MDSVLPRISVIIPIYNIQDYLEACVDSVCAQTYTNLQIILVDDGSVDDSGRICDQFGKADPRITVIHKRNGGLISARKAGIARAEGIYVSFIDGDDWIDENTFEQLLPYMADPVRCDVIAYGCIEEYGGYRVYKQNEVDTGVYTGGKLEKLRENILMGDTFFDWRILPHLCDKVIKRELLTQCIKNVSDEISFGEDAACMFPCVMRADSICFLNIAPYHYRQREGSIVKEQKELRASNFQCVYDVLSEAFAGGAELKVQLKYYLFFMLCLKAYSKIGSQMPLFPFEKIQKGSRIFIYGAGGFGKVIERYVRGSNDLELIGWADQRAEYYRRQGYAVDSCEKIFEACYDYLVIAILNEKTAERIKDDFVRRGIPGEKINFVRKEVFERRDLPEWIRHIS